MLILSTTSITFFLGLLWRVEKEWSHGNILHFTLHFNDLIFSAFFSADYGTKLDASVSRMFHVALVESIVKP